LPCFRTTPIPILDASVSISKGISKFGKASTGCDVIAFIVEMLARLDHSIGMLIF